ncbi:MAG: (E)-4-hydroxy-3-methylbut-2-enyl-diphosphate synthase [Planctomycetota bacterium]|jgi:(E)-4-hydroxy-3-methylbut-2-enyl-diphosphate synthase
MSRSYVPSRFAWHRRASLPARVGDIIIGGGAPIVVQSMCTTPTQDVAATLGQCISLAEAGCELIRITAPGVKDAVALKDIRRQFNAAGFGAVPLVADIHFMPKAALEAIEHVEKVRVNPGNFADKKAFAVHEYSDAEYAAEVERVGERFRPLVRRAKELGRCLRIGVNHGSLSDRIMNRFGDSPEGMVESALEFIRYCEADDFHDIVVSMKSSNPKVMIQAYRQLVAALDAHGAPYPLHLGVTEAGDGDDGRAKGAAGIGALLEDGIGDTIRVSLTEAPEAEIPVARALADAYRRPGVPETPPANAPTDPVDPYHFQRRTAEIVRLAGNDLAIGGGQVPAVLVPELREHTDDGEPLADAIVKARPSHSDGRVLERASASCPTPITLGDSITLLDLDADPCATLRDRLAALPATSAVGIGRPGPLGHTRAYRLLAAIDEELFAHAEANAPGSGVRHAIVISLPGVNNLLAASAIAGGLLADGIGDALYLPDLPTPRAHAYTILQAVKARVTRADYVACPSCGRTLFDLMEVTEHIKQATAHLDGVTIAIMGCIVNGPGEMADADFGYVGAGPDKITLYRGREAVRRNIPFDQARDALIELIKEHGMWKDPT